MSDHMCPFGLKSRDVLNRHGYDVEDNHLTSRDEIDAFKEKHGVATTPQVFIDDKRIGGYEDLLRHLDEDVPDKDATTYTPVIALFGMAAAMALAGSWATHGRILTITAAEWFIAFSMCLRAGRVKQVLRDFEAEPFGVHVIYPHSRHLAAKVRVLVDFLAEHYRGTPPWDRGW